MASTLANGDYTIVPALKSTLCLDVSCGSRSDGANVQIYTSNLTAAQRWHVTATSTGYEILTSWLGKSLDVPGGSTQSGANVQIYRDNDSRAQRWDVTDTGETLTVDGTAYPLYTVASHGTKLVLDVSSGQAQAGTNVQIYTANQSTAQKWAFVPVPAFSSGGVYEVRSMLATGMALDAKSGGTADGTNIQLYGSNHTNAQKFYATDEGDGWSLRNVQAGKYVDVASGTTAASGSNVQLYSDNDSRAQRWKVSEVGTRTVDGRKCAVVRLGAGNADTCVMDVTGAMARGGSNVQIYADNDSNAQKWVMYPTLATDPNMPTPYSLGLATAVGSSGTTSLQPQATLYPTWRCADAWVTDGSNSYRWRWRKRTMSTTGAWSGWGAWAAWATASARQDGATAWETHGIGVNYTFASGIKNEQVELQVCSQGVDDAQGITSNIADKVIDVVRCPTLKVTGAAWSGDGLRVSYETDYPYGTMTVHMRALTFAGKSALKAAVDVKARYGSFLVPSASVTSVPAEGAAARLAFTLGSDQKANFGTNMTGSATVAYDAGTVSVAPTVEDTTARTLRLTVARANTVRMWAVVDGESAELTGTVSGSKTVFEYIYPFGRQIGLFTSYANSDGSAWGTDYTAVAAKASPGAHLWNWDGGSLAIGLSSDAMGEELKYATESEKHALSGRSRPVVSFLADSNGRSYISVTGTAKGVLADGDGFGCTVDDVEALLEQGHATYRGPGGRRAEVAVTAADVTRYARYTEVSVTMTEEQL